MNPIIMLLLRHLLSIITGALVLRGWITSEEAQSVTPEILNWLIALVTGGVAITWSVKDKKRTEKTVESLEVRNERLARQLKP